MSLVMMFLTHPSHDSLLRAVSIGAYLLLGTVGNASSSLHRHLAATFSITSLPGWAVRATQSFRLHILWTPRMCTRFTLGTMPDAQPTLYNPIGTIRHRTFATLTLPVGILTTISAVCR